MRRQPERAIQAAGVKLLRSLGADVWVLGTTRRRGDYHGTMMTPGLPDVMAAIPPQRGAYQVALGIGRVHPPMRWVMWEAKAPGGKLRPEQARFRDCCLEANIAHVVGDENALIQWLIANGYLRPDQVNHERLR